MTDLTRFDFHALRFTKSESVQAMTCEEVGQYILLLCESWLTGKDASLPDDLSYLARLARSKVVSDRVLAMFPVVDTQWGPRRRNETLYNEWQETIARSMSASASGRLGNAIRWGKDSTPIAPRSLPDRTLDRSNRTESNRLESNQAEPNQSGTFKFISTRFRSHFNIRPADTASVMERYQSACKQYGEDTVLDQFDAWAGENQWVREKKARFALTAFFNQLEEIMEAEQMRVEREKKDVKPGSPTQEDVQKVKQKMEEEAKKVHDTPIEREVFTDAI